MMPCYLSSLLKSTVEISSSDSPKIHRFFLACFQGMLTYHIASQNMQWSYVFGALESQKQRLGIVDYSVSQTTLEQVRI
jgi:hypothetical protein